MNNHLPSVPNPFLLFLSSLCTACGSNYFKSIIIYVDRSGRSILIIIIEMINTFVGAVPYLGIYSRPPYSPCSQ
jgi:hypothetical protein